MADEEETLPPDETPPTIVDDPAVYYVVYHQSGKIRQSGSCARSLVAVHGTIFGGGYSAMEVPPDHYDRDIDKHCYVLGGMLTTKGTAVEVTDFTIKADGTEEARFALPAGTSVIHEGRIVAIEDNVFEFATDVPGDHEFSFQAPAAYRDFEVTIHAV